MHKQQQVNKLLDSKHFWAIIILLINLLQAQYTNLHDDEAYYWLFSKHLDWGFFDHPPMVAIFVKLGFGIFNSTLGVRSLAIISSVASFYLLFCFGQFRYKTAWVALAYLSVPILNLYGFIITPDVPLILFGILYLLALKAVIEHKKWVWIGLGVTMALLAYSKYHGAIIVFFSLLPIINKKTIKPIFLAILLALLLFIPHILWQVENDWPSFQYHLLSRHKGFKLEYLFEFLGALFLIPGVFFLWPFLNRNQTIQGDFDKSLKFIYWGFIAFFALMLSKGKIEIHWIAFAAVPALLLCLKKELLSIVIFKRLMLAQLLIILVLRLVLASYADDKLESFRKDQKWANGVKKLSQNYPVVFMNSFQKAAKYQFYTGQLAWSDNNRFLRKNQFDLWTHDTLLYGKDVYYLSNYRKGSFISDSLGRSFGGIIKKYIPMQRISAKCTASVESLTSDTLKLKVHYTVNNPYHYAIDMLHPQMGQRFYIWLLAPKKNKVVKLQSLIGQDEPISIPIGQSEYDFEISTDFAGLLETDKIKAIPLIMKGPLYSQILGPEIDIILKPKD